MCEPRTEPEFLAFVRELHSAKIADKRLYERTAVLGVRRLRGTKGLARSPAKRGQPQVVFRPHIDLHAGGVMAHRSRAEQLAIAAELLVFPLTARVPNADPISAHRILLDVYRSRLIEQQEQGAVAKAECAHGP